MKPSLPFSRTTLSLAIAACLGSGAPLISANPTGGVVVSGNATFNNSGNVLTITNTPGTIINWNQFNIGTTELTQFLQQSSQSTVLNRITGQNGSQILGTLQSNGRVILFNPNGIVFGKGAVVNVNELVATSLDISNADFMANHFNYSNGAGAGAVINQGAITTPMGGSIYLIGNSVSNQGVLTSPGGKVVLAAGNTVSMTDSAVPAVSVTLTATANQAVNLGQISAAGGSVDIYGALINQQGVIRADSASTNANGQIVLQATQSTQESGTVSATNNAGKGGSIEILGNDVTLTSSASIDASGASGGGTVLVGGALHGANPTIQNASTATMAAGSNIRADATGNGNGGNVVLWSNDNTNFAGSISARGGTQGGNGGYVETSGHSLTASGSVNTLAPKGITGTWLQDPASFCFYVSGSNECTFNNYNASSQQSLAALDSSLSTSNVTIAATDYVVFMPDGGNYQFNSRGTSLNIQSPYILFGNNPSGQSLNFGTIALNWNASGTFGTSSIAGKTGTIDIDGTLTSSANQALTSSGDMTVYVLSSNAGQTLKAGGDLIVGGSQSNGASYIASALGQNIVVGGTLSVVSGSAPASGPNSGITSATVVSTGPQVINANAIVLTGGTNTAAAGATDNNVAVIQTFGGASQTVTANTISLQGGAAGSYNLTSINSSGAQTVSAQNIALTGGLTGNNNGASIIANGQQNITITGGANALMLTAGGSTSADFNDSAIFKQASSTSGGQNIIFTGTGAAVVFQAGAGSSLSGDISHNCPSSCTGSSSANWAGINNLFGNQNVDFQHGGSLNLYGGKLGNANFAYLTDDASSGSQTIGSSTGSANYPSISLNGGTSGGSSAVLSPSGGNELGNYASITSYASQTIDAASIATRGVVPGSTSSPILGGAGITQYGVGGSQAITVNGAISMTGGDGATANPSNSGTQIYSAGSGGQTVNAASITLTGGFSGVGNPARIMAAGANETQTITVTNGITLTAGGHGSTDLNDGVQISSSGNQTLQAGSLSLAGGLQGNNNAASVNASATQQINLSGSGNVLTLKAGGTTSSDYNDVAVIYQYGTTAGSQAITLSGANAVVLIQGGAGSSSNGYAITGCVTGCQGVSSSNWAGISNYFGNQTLDFQLGGSLTIQAGGVGTSNNAYVYSYAPSGLQTIGSSGGSANYPSITLVGGPSGGPVNTSANYNGDLSNVATIGTTNSSQTIQGTNITLAGGSGGNANGALIWGQGANVTQSITATNLTLTGGANGISNSAQIQNDAGNSATQTITANTITLSASGNASGSTGTGGAYFFNTGATGNQTISANQITVQAGAVGIFNNAEIDNYSSGNQTINLTGTSPTLIITAGGSTGSYNNDASIYNGLPGTTSPSAGNQTVTINGGGSIKLTGGNGNGTVSVDGASNTPSDMPTYCPQCLISANSANILNEANGTQTLNFVTGGSLTLTGGSQGSFNVAMISQMAGANAQQIITSSGGKAFYPSITLTGGSGGYYSTATGADLGNDALICSDLTGSSSGQANTTINASTIALQGSGNGNTQGAALIGSGNNNTVTTTGAITITGGSSSVSVLAGSGPDYTTDRGAIAAIFANGNLSLSVGGNLTLAGGSGTSSPAGVFSGGNGAGSMTLNVNGTTSLSSGASVALIQTPTTQAQDWNLYPSGTVAIEIEPNSTFNTGSLLSKSQNLTLVGDLNLTGSQPVPASIGQWTYGGGKSLDLVVTVTGTLDSSNGSVNLPTNGTAIAAVASGGTAIDADAMGPLTYTQVSGYGFQSSQFASNSLGYQFYIPQASNQVSQTNLSQSVSQTQCASNPALCTTTTTVNNNVAASNAIVAAEVSAPVTVAVQLTGSGTGVDAGVASAGTSASTSGSATTPAAASATSAGSTTTISGPSNTASTKSASVPASAAAHANPVTADETKSVSDLKSEIKQIAADQKKLEAQAKVSEDAAKGKAAEAKHAASEAAKAETEANKSVAEVGKAVEQGRKAEADLKQAQDEEKAATTPTQVQAAQVKQSTAQANKSEAQAKQADAEEKVASANAKQADAKAKQADSEAANHQAAALRSEANAKKAEVESKDAVIAAKSTANPAQKTEALQKADAKRVDSEKSMATADVLNAKAELAQSEANVKRSEQHQQQALSEQRAADKQVNTVQAEISRADAAIKKGETEGGAKGNKIVADAQKKKSAAAEALVKAQRDADSKKQIADQKMADAASVTAVHVGKVEQARVQAVKSFAKLAIAAESRDSLAHISAVRHEYLNSTLKPALTVLQKDPTAADLPTCGGANSQLCIPAHLAVTQSAANTINALTAPLKPIETPKQSYLPQIQRKIAVMIGINSYDDNRIPLLEGALPDAEAVGKILNDKMGYDVHMVPDASKADIINALNEIGRTAGPDDSVTIYYAGHGYLQDGGKHGYWIPRDASAVSPKNWISNGDITRLLNNIPARQVILLSDSCYSGSLTEEQKITSRQAEAASILNKRSVTIMSSGGEEPVSDEGRDGHSIFAWAFMDTLKGVDKYQLGATLYDSVRKDVVAEFPQVPQYGAALSARHTLGGDYLFEVRSYK